MLLIRLDDAFPAAYIHDSRVAEDDVPHPESQFAGQSGEEMEFGEGGHFRDLRLLLNTPSVIVVKKE